MDLNSLRQNYIRVYNGLVALERGIALQVLNRAKGGSEHNGGYHTVEDMEQFKNRISRSVTVHKFANRSPRSLSDQRVEGATTGVCRRDVRICSC
jgi:hypothetical protein